MHVCVRACVRACVSACVRIRQRQGGESLCLCLCPRVYVSVYVCSQCSASQARASPHGGHGAAVKEEQGVLVPAGHLPDRSVLQELQKLGPDLKHVSVHSVSASHSIILSPPRSSCLAGCRLQPDCHNASVDRHTLID